MLQNRRMPKSKPAVKMRGFGRPAGNCVNRNGMLQDGALEQSAYDNAGLALTGVAHPLNPKP